MADIKLTQAQSLAAGAKGCELLVSAAAGSGKTAVLTKRVISLITGENPPPADKLVIVTFTVAAAEEMRHRISSALEEELYKTDNRELIETQQILLQNAKICTIDSLCRSIVSENFNLLGFTANTSLETGERLDILKSEIIAEVLEEYYTENSPEFNELFNTFCSKTDIPLAEMISEICRYITSFAFPKDYLADVRKMYEQAENMIESPWYAEFAGRVADVLETLIVACKKAVDISLQNEMVAERYSPVIQREEQEFLEIRNYILEGKHEEAAQIGCGFSKETIYQPSRDPVIKEICAEVVNVRDEYVKRFFESVQPLLKFSQSGFEDDMLLQKRRIGILLDMVEKTVDRFATAKRENEIMDFGDIEHFALSLLIKKENGKYVKTQLGEEISRDIAEVMVDECQDINNLQSTLFRALSKDGKNLFMVGDVKQSVYHFRNASPHIFIEKKKSFSKYEEGKCEQGGYITLDANFRSRKEVCDCVNDLFADVMSEQVGEIAYTSEERLVAKAEYPQAEDYKAELHIVNMPSKSKVGEGRTEEAKYIASLIAEYIKSGFQVYDGEKLRACKYSDFAVLFRKKAAISSVYAAEIQKLGIPCSTQVGESFYESYEISSMLAFLRVIDNPLLDMSLFTAMLSPLIGLSAEDIAQIRTYKKKCKLYNALKLYSNENEKGRRVIDAIEHYRQYSAANNIEELIRYIINTTDYMAVVNAMSGGEQRIANLKLLIEKAKGYEQNSAGGLSGFLRCMADAAKSSSQSTAAPPAGENSVRLMTIHGSKGLEFPICILADFDNGFNKKNLSKKYMLNDKLGISTVIADKQKNVEYTNIAHEAVKSRNLNEYISEEMRVLYVAMTRAKEKLIMCCAVKDGREGLFLTAAKKGSPQMPCNVLSAGSFAQWVAMSILNKNSSIKVKEVEPIKQKRNEIQDIEPVSVNQELAGRLREAIQYEYPFSEQTSIPAKLTVTQIAKAKKGEGVKLSAKPAFLSDGGFSPAEKGTLLHRFMQFADFAAAEMSVQDEIKRLTEQGIFSEAEANALECEKIGGFLSSELYNRMKSAECFREYKFNCYISPAEANLNVSKDCEQVKIFIQGIADCIFKEADGLVLVDYKTDKAENEGIFKERYYDQLRIYKRAVEAAFNLPVKQAMIYSLYLSKEILIDV